MGQTPLRIRVSTGKIPRATSQAPRPAYLIRKLPDFWPVLDNNIRSSQKNPPDALVRAQPVRAVFTRHVPFPRPGKDNMGWSGAGKPDTPEPL